MITPQTKLNTTNTNHRNIPSPTKAKQYQEILKASTIAKQQGLTTQTHMHRQYKGIQITTKLYNTTNETPDKQFLLLEQNVQRRKGLFRCKVFLYRAYILEQSSLDEMKGI